MRHVIVRSFHHLELQLVFFLQRYRPERRDAEQRRNVRFRRGVAVVVIVRLSTVENISARFGGRHFKISDNDLLGDGFQRGHAVGKLRDETIGSGRRWRAGVGGQRRGSTANRRLRRRGWRYRRGDLRLAVVILTLLAVQHVRRLRRRRWIVIVLRHNRLWHVGRNAGRRR